MKMKKTMKQSSSERRSTSKGRSRRITREKAYWEMATQKIKRRMKRTRKGKERVTKKKKKRKKKSRRQLVSLPARYAAADA